MANIEFQGFLFDALGVAVQSATVDLLDRNTTTPVRATTTTDSNGFYTISHGTEGRFDIRITSGTNVLFRKYDTAGQMIEMEVASLNIRNPADTFKYDILPAAITADRTLTLPLLTGTAILATIDEGFKGSDISSVGAALTLVAGSDYADVTGTTTVTSISTRPAGSRFTFQFDAALILTHNNTSLILQGAINHTTAAGDVFTFISEGSGNWREESRRLVTPGNVIFPATQVASSDANTLDDYEEGTWTMTVQFGGNSVSQTYATNTGSYTKKGREVTVTGSISLTAKGSSTGDATLAGLPFTSATGNQFDSAATFRMVNTTFANQFQGYVDDNVAVVFIQEVTEAGTGTALTEGNFTDTSGIRIELTYFTT